MSLQNILVPNNYSIYANEFIVNDLIVADTLTAETIVTKEIQPYTGNDISVAGNIVLPNSLSLGREIGSTTSYFSNLWCERLQGAGSAVIAQNGITGEDGTNPLIIHENGLQFLTNPITDQSVLNKYFHGQGTVHASGFFVLGPLPVNYSVTVVGNTVTFALGYFNGAGGAADFITFSFAALPELVPATTQSFTIPMLFGGNRTVVGGIVDATGITIYSSLNNNTFNNSMNPVGLSIPSGSFYNITYQLN